MPKVTVCIIARNQPKMVKDAIRSVYSQTFRDFDVVVVDDASDDGVTRESITQVVGAYPPDIKAKSIFRSVRGWPAKARRTGIAATESEFILPLDGDDMLEPTHLERTVGAIGAADVCFTNYRYFGDMDGVVESGPWDGLFERNTVPICSLVRRTSYEAVGGFDSCAQWLTDYDLWRSLFYFGFKGVHVPEPLFLYRRHTGQWTHAQEGRPAAEDAFRKKWLDRPLKEMTHG